MPFAQRKGVTFRADGGTDIGLGHIIGSLRLARLLRNELGVDVTFRTKDDRTGDHSIGNNGDNHYIVKLIRSHGFHCELFQSATPAQDFALTLESIAGRGDRTVIVNFCDRDIIAYTGSYKLLRDGGVCLIFQDNAVAPSFWDGDLLFNPLPHPDEPGYNPAEIPNCLDGLEYFLLEDEHYRLAENRRNPGEAVNRVLVAMGGGDAVNHTETILRGLAKARFRGFVDVVIGGVNPHEMTLRRTLGDTGLRGEINRAVSDLPSRIQQADIGFSALGLTTYEMGFLALPVILIPGSSFNRGVAELYVQRIPTAVVLPEEEVNPDGVAELFTRLQSGYQIRLAMSRAGVTIGSCRQDVVNAFRSTLEFLG